jgi:hypothetical protein
MMVIIIFFNMPFGEIPVALRILEEKNCPVIDQNDATRGLHELSRLAIGQVNCGEMFTKNLLGQRAHPSRHASFFDAIETSRIT